MKHSDRRYFGKKYCWNKWDCCERFCIELRFLCPCAIYQKQIESISETIFSETIFKFNSIITNLQTLILFHSESK